jgi:hypothetical protein
MKKFIQKMSLTSEEEKVIRDYENEQRKQTITKYILRKKNHLAILEDMKSENVSFLHCIQYPDTFGRYIHFWLIVIATFFLQCRRITIQEAKNARICGASKYYNLHNVSTCDYCRKFKEE